MNATRIFSTVAWSALLAAVIYFIDIWIINIMAILFGSFLVSGSILDRNGRKMLVLKIVLMVLLIIVYGLR